MRYIIETTSEGVKANVWNTVQALDKKGLIRIIEQGDPIQNMKENMKRIREAMDSMKAAGIDRELLVAFIRHKSSTISKTEANEVLDLQQDFFKKFEVKK